MRVETALVVFVPEADALAAGLREDLGVPPLPMEPHVSVLYPFRHPDLVGGEDLAALRDLFGSHEPFDFLLAETGRFPEVVYLEPDPAGRFKALTEAVVERYPDCPPYWGLYEEVVPHCTVAHTDDAGVLAAAAAAVRPALPIASTARHVVLMEEREGVWAERARFSLGT